MDSQCSATRPAPAEAAGLVVKLMFPSGEIRRARVPHAQRVSLAWIRQRVAAIVRSCSAPDGAGGASGCGAGADEPVAVRPLSVKLKYRDDEGDWITLASPADLTEAVAVVQEAGLASLRVMVLGAVVTPAPHATACAAKSTHHPAAAAAADGSGGCPPSAPVPARTSGGQDDGSGAADGSGESSPHEAASSLRRPVSPTAASTAFVARAVPTGAGGNYVRVSRGTRVVMKTFRLKNEGAQQWPIGVRLVHVGGELVGASPDGVAVPRAVPGETVSVRVTLVVPPDAGVYATEWRLWAPAAPTQARGSTATGLAQLQPAGFKFGHRVWLDVEVGGGEATATGAAPARGAATTGPVASAGTGSQLHKHDFISMA